MYTEKGDSMKTLHGRERQEDVWVTQKCKSQKLKYVIMDFVSLPRTQAVEMILVIFKIIAGFKKNNCSKYKAL